MKKLMAVFTVIVLFAFAAPAFAANPFMDVPTGHWAYDAVAQLAARGIVSGYPDGTYKGVQPATRYELASVIARAMTRLDMDKASRQDVEIMKRLMLEFKDELDALGVKVDQLDKRVAKLEDGIGGWKIRGIFRFDAKFAGSEREGQYEYAGTQYQFNSGQKKNEFNKEQFRLYLTKTIDENTYFYAQMRTGGDSAGGDGRGDQQHQRWSHLFVDTKLPWDIGLRVGRFAVDFEDDYGLYIDNDALFGDFRTDGFRLTKAWNTVTGTAIIGRNDATNNMVGTGTHMTYALDLNWTPNEKFFAGATAYMMKEDSHTGGGDWDANTYGIYAGFNFTPAIALKGIYYFQDLGTDVAYLDWDMTRPEAPEDSPKAWKVILDVKQEALKFTSLWVEYSQMDNTLWSPTAYDRYAIGGSGYDYIGINHVKNNGTSKWFFATAKQQWNDKWSTFVRYATVDFDSHCVDDATEWGIGTGYQYTPAIYFELMYDQIKHGEADKNRINCKEHVVRFRTTVTF